MPDGRIDYDAPKDGEAYVIRVETADHRRLKSAITFRELAMDLQMPAAELIGLKARHLGEQLAGRARS